MTGAAATPRRRMDPGARRAVLLDAAMEYFDAEGIDVPLEAVAKAAGISPALMRHYFGTRDGLLLALFRDRLPGLTSVFTATDIGVREQLTTYLAWIERRPWAHQIWVAAVNDPARDPALRQEILAARRVLIERAAGRPWDEHDHNLRARAQAFVAAFEAAVGSWLDSGRPARDVLLADLSDIATRLGIAGRLTHRSR